MLQPEDEEPFILASVKKGQARMAVDTYMFKTGALCRHRLPHACPTCPDKGVWPSNEAYLLVFGVKVDSCLQCMVL